LALTRSPIRHNHLAPSPIIPNHPQSSPRRRQSAPMPSSCIVQNGEIVRRCVLATLERPEKAETLLFPGRPPFSPSLLLTHQGTLDWADFGAALSAQSLLERQDQPGLEAPPHRSVAVQTLPYFPLYSRCSSSYYYYPRSSSRGPSPVLPSRTPTRAVSVLDFAYNAPLTVPRESAAHPDSRDRRRVCGQSPRV
jgi:hypothetical protein